MQTAPAKITKAVFLFLVCVFAGPLAAAQDEVRVAWQVQRFDITANIQQAARTLDATAIIQAKNVGRSQGTTLTFRLNTKAVVKSASVGGVNANFRVVPETQGNVQRVTTTLPRAVGAGESTTLTVNYTLPVETNTGLTAISPIASQFLPLSFWFPLPNSPFSVRGADTAPFKLTVNPANVISSGMERGNGVFEQSLNSQPFFVQGDWERIEGAGEAKNISALLAKGVSAEERKNAETLVNLAAAARTFYSTVFGPAPDAPVRIVSVKRGSGFNEGGTLLLDASVFRRPKIDAGTAMLVAESVARLWLGGQVAIRGEGSGMLRDGFARYLATQFIEKNFGKEAGQAELLRQRTAYAAVSRRDGPLARATQLDDTYFSAVPNKGAMVWRLIEQFLGRDALFTTLRTLLQTNKDAGLTLAGVRSALVEKGGERLKVALDHHLDQVTDTDLMVGVPVQRGAEWVSALRNLGAVDAVVKVAAVTDRGERIVVEGVVPARGFSEAKFRVNSKIVRVEVDPDKVYPQLDYGNDVAPWVRSLPEGLAEATRLLNSQDFAKAEVVARELLAAAPQMQEARIVLARALLAQSKVDEAERTFRQAIDDPLPTAISLAWGSVGLGQVSLRRGQAAEAAKRFNEAVRIDADYSTSVLARAERIKAEAAASSPAPVDESVKAFIAQLDSAILSGKKAELETRIVSGELVRFVSGIVGTQPGQWQTRVMRTETVDADTVMADVAIQAKELGQDRAGTALLILSRVGGSWKLFAIELFEVR